MNGVANAAGTAIAFASMKKIALVLAIAYAAELHAAYHVVRHIKIGGTGGWDYLTVDIASRRLYLSHSDRVEVVDIDHQKVIGTIPKTEGVHGIAIAPDLHRGFVSNGRAGTMTIFDLDKLTTIAEVKVTGDNPDAILYDPATKHVFTFNGRGKNSTVFDGDGKVIATIPLEGKPEFAVCDRKGHVFVNIEDKSEIADIDSKKLTVEHKWPLAPCEEPSGMAMDTKTRRIFSGCHNKMVAVMDADTGKVVATPAIGSGVDATGFDPGTGLVFNSCGDTT